MGSQTMAMNGSAYMEAVRNRRTIHNLGKDTGVSEERVTALVKETVLHSPSEFNAQHARVVILFGEQHDKLWDLIRGILREKLSAESIPRQMHRMDMFRGGMGTVLFYRDEHVVERLKEKYPQYLADIPVWAEQSSGMLQVMVWTALEAEGLGASLQHYNPHIDDRVRQEWAIPADWKLVAQMPFGKPMQEPREKAIVPADDRVIVFK